MNTIDLTPATKPSEKKHLEKKSLGKKPSEKSTLENPL